MRKKILPVLLTLAMVLGMLPLSVFAASEGETCTDPNCAHVAAIGDTHYSTIQAAIDAATDGTETTITVLKDVDANTLVAHIKANDVIVLDLNGKTIKSSYTSYTVSVAAKDAPQTAGEAAKPAGKLTIIGSGNIYNSSGSTAVRNYGTMIIGAADATNFPTIGRTEAQTAFKQNSAIKCEEDSTLTIYGGTFTGYDRSLQSFGSTTIHNGTFTGTVEAWKYADSSHSEGYPSTLTINDGTFEGSVDSKYTDQSTSEIAGAVVDIKGGKFKTAPTTGTYVKIPTGKEFQVENGYSVLKDSTSALTGANIMEITSVAAIDKTNIADAKISVKPNTPLKWVAKDATIGRGYDGWWIGFKAIAPDSVIQSNLSSVKYRNNGDLTDKATFETSNDGKEGNNYYIQLWGGISEDIIKTFTAAGKTELTYVWYFNWDGNDATGQTIPATSFKSATGTGTATEMKGVDQIITLTFDLKQIKLIGTSAEDQETVVWEYKPDITVTPDENGTAQVDDTAALGVIAAAADSKVPGDSTATITVTPAEDATSAAVALSKDVISAANTAANTNENLKLAVSAGELGTVTLDKGAITSVNTVAAANQDSDAKVTISIANVAEADIAPEQKPTVTGNDKLAASYEIVVKVGGTEVANWTNSNITLTVPAPESVEAASQVKVYLDQTLASDAVVTLNADGTLDVTVPHLTVVNLVVSEQPVTSTVEITSVKTDVSVFAKVQVTGMKSDKIYLIRIAQGTGKVPQAVLYVTGKTTHEFYCNTNDNGQQDILVWELGSSIPSNLPAPVATKTIVKVS